MPSKRNKICLQRIYFISICVSRYKLLLVRFRATPGVEGGGVRKDGKGRGMVTRKGYYGHVLYLCTLFTFQLCPYLNKGNAGTIVKTRNCIQSTNSVLKKNQLLLQTTDNKTSFFLQRYGG